MDVAFFMVFSAFVLGRITGSGIYRTGIGLKMIILKRCGGRVE
jgi:hypothetical protein